MEAPAELLAALPALATALALLLAWLLVRRGSAAPPEPAGAPPAQASGTPKPPGPSARELAAAPRGAGGPEGPAGAAEAKELATEERQEKELETEQKKVLPRARLQEDGGDPFFKYSPGKLRGNQYKQMMTKEELEEEQRIELTSDLTSL
ncbi:matrix-remodeling-associated protein 7 isoform X2 [Erinaceus europaeus]|uniref:Matrix-remodeling-associated protein 7 isoform X2 n=1 Tax=Erinaceus europaeus TaxID=9365 RepID=A0ABM3YCJ9_ERIEU|nr:matrix-remodeling-associated protein 7 isoform X2 [Erinaceus europaeus]XP_060058790.1 matrix-remodeling-associated protein 7 isoform X2 [Erinaceus europaeus]